MSEDMDNSVPVNDSREKLEADVYEICRGDNKDRYLALIDYYKVNMLDVKFDSVFANYEGHLFKAVLEHMLNRQAAISWDNAWKAQKDLIAKMQAEIDELTTERDNLQFKVTSFYDMCGECKLVCDECKLVASLTAERDQLKAKCDKLKGRLENQATYIAGVEDNLCRYELQLVRNEKDFDKLTAERDRLQAIVDALKHDQENVEPAATDDRLTAGQAREIRTKSDGKWVQRTSERIIREFLYQVRERSEQGLSDYTLNLSTYPSDEVRKTVLKELSELGYKYVRYHFWSKKRYIVYW